MVADPDGTRDYFFGSHRSTGGNARFVFQMPKPPGTVRVFLYGGSVIKGFPQPRHLTPSSFLQVMLEDVWPNREIEVINFGTTAVASFPVCDMLERTIWCEPDLVVIYTGHNEFYGAYGAASSNQAGSRPWIQRLHWSCRALALVQAFQSLRAPPGKGQTADLMRAMVGQDYLGPNDWRREAAARNLGHNLRRIIKRCHRRGVPVIVCTLPSNERDLSPIGREDVKTTGVPELTTESADPDQIESDLRKLLNTLPTSAKGHYELGKLLYAQGRHREASACFLRARDLDTMPWRATTTSQQTIRETVDEEDAVLSDVEALFHERSPGGCIGWELMVDHVHPTVQGQALIAEAIVRSMTAIAGDLRVDAAALSRLQSWEDYAAEVGASDYDHYAVARSMQIVFNIPFMETSNPEALNRFNNLTAQMAQEQPEDILRILRNWDGKTPINVLVAGVFIRQGRLEEALPLLRSAQHGTTRYSADYVEAVYNELGCLSQMKGISDDALQRRILKEIEHAKQLLRLNTPEPWMLQRTIGRLHVLRKEYAQAIPYLLTVNAQLQGSNRLMDDRVLVRAYLEIGDPESARTVAYNGLRQGRAYSQAYVEMLTEIANTSTNQAAGVTQSNRTYQTD